MSRRLALKMLEEELMPCAEQVAALLKSRGYRIRAEHREVGFPCPPTLCCTRKPVVLLVEIVDKLDQSRVSEWVAYCRAVSVDTRIALGMPEEVAPSMQDVSRLQELGVGLYLVGAASVKESLVPTDQGMHGSQATLPELATLPHSVRVLLGPAYEQLTTGDWRGAFQDACQAFEDDARRYLKHWSKTTRIKIQRKGGPEILSRAEIERFTMGQLAKAFADILSPNQVDSIIAQTLQAVVGDRNRLTHKKRKAHTEARLRRNWRGHFWKIVGALRAIHA